MRSLTHCRTATSALPGSRSLHASLRHCMLHACARSRTVALLHHVCPACQPGSDQPRRESDAERRHHSHHLHARSLLHFPSLCSQRHCCQRWDTATRQPLAAPRAGATRGEGHVPQRQLRRVRVHHVNLNRLPCSRCCLLDRATESKHMQAAQASSTAIPSSRLFVSISSSHTHHCMGLPPATVLARRRCQRFMLFSRWSALPVVQSFAICVTVSTQIVTLFYTNCICLCLC